MAGDEKTAPESQNTERTLLDSPEDTTPPEEDVTQITDSLADSKAEPDATVIERSHPTAPGDPSVTDSTLDDATIIEAGSVPRADDVEPTLLAGEDPASASRGEEPQPRDTEKTFLMEPSVDERAVHENDTTLITPSMDSVPSNTTLAMPGDSGTHQSHPPSEYDPTVVGYTGNSERDPDATEYDSRAGSFDPDDNTLVQRDGTASGTATDYVPPEGSADGKEFPNLGRFEILKLLGQGAFGAVYLAHDPHLDRKVAIKVAKTGVLVGKQDVDRFMREARSAAQLRHPNIVPVYEVGQLPNTNFIAYEYIEGRTLGDVIKERKKLTWDEATTYMKKIAAGLHYAHQHGIVHRDMKPDNVLLDVNDEPHIADFGLARRDEKDTTRTREGMFMGTPSYMSPEQASGKAHLADARSDVWSLGVMLQEMLTGVRPFTGNVTQVLVAVQNHEPESIRTIDKAIPADLETIVGKCLIKNPAQRYQSAQLLADELERWQRGEPILARPVTVFDRTWRWMKRNPEIASLLGTIAAIVLLSSVGIGGFGWSAMKSAERAQKAAVARAESQLFSIRTADAASLPVLVGSLEPYRGELRKELLSLVDNASLSKPEQSRVRLAATTLYPDAPQHDRLLQQTARDLLDVSPGELVVRTGMLQPFREEIEVPLWDLAQDGVLPQRRRFQALAALASLKSTLPEWPALVSDMVAEMLTMNPFELSAWLPAVAPVQSELEGALVRAFEESTNAGEQYQAAIMLGELFRETPQVLLELVPKAQPQQLAPLIDALEPRADFFAERLSAQLQDTLPDPGEPLEDERAARAVNLSLALLGLGRGEPVWPLFEQSPDERLRTALIHTAVPAGISWQEIAARMEFEQDPGTLIALCLTLGEYGEGELLPTDRDRLADGLLKSFQSHPHAGVHSATEWVLRRWGRQVEVDAATAQLKSKEPPADRNWHVDNQQMTFAVIEPATFEMGSPASEAQRLDAEVQHRRLIPRTYGIATREVTVAEYMEFDPEYNLKLNRRWAPEQDCPVINVSWYDAAAFCRWLSEKEGFEEHQMCYPSLDDLDQLRKSFGGKSLELPADLLDRPGYRLPTAAEWEYACRAGSATARPFGSSPAWAGQYAWYRENGQDRTWPAGQLKPNDFGLFDIQGNALEWCHNYFFDTPPAAGAEGVVIDGPDSRDGYNRECRGGSYQYQIERLRTAFSDPIAPNTRYFDLGFRVARTYVASNKAETNRTARSD